MDVIQSRPEILEIIKAVSEEQGLKNWQITDVQTNKKGEGFLGEIFLVTITDGKNGVKNSLNIVIKVAFHDEGIRQVAPIRMSYENEVYSYGTLLKRLQSFVEGNGGKWTEFIPTCLKSSLEPGMEYLVLENLKIQGFDNPNKKLSLDKDHLKIIFETYGQFHGQSFALRDKCPEDFNEIQANLKPVYSEIGKSEQFKAHMENLVNRAAKSLTPGDDDKVLEKLKKYQGSGNAARIMKESRENSEYLCILHGDCWSNNLMFKYEIIDGKRKPVDIRLLDWQLDAVGSPVCDLSYCLYSGGSKEVYDDLDIYLGLYHKSFSRTVKELGCDPDKLYPLEALKGQWKKYSKFGLLMGIMIWSIKTTESEDMIDLTDFDSENPTKFDFSNMKGDEELFNSRVKDVLEHMSEIGAL